MISFSNPIESKVGPSFQEGGGTTAVPFSEVYVARTRSTWSYGACGSRWNPWNPWNRMDVFRWLELLTFDFQDPTRFIQDEWLLKRYAIFLKVIAKRKEHTWVIIL